MSTISTPIDPTQKRPLADATIQGQGQVPGAGEYNAIAQLAVQALLTPAAGADRDTTRGEQGPSIAQGFSASEPASARGDDRRSDPDLAEDARGSDWEYTQAVANRSTTDMSRVNAHELTTRGERSADVETLADAPETSAAPGRNAAAKGERAQARDAQLAASPAQSGTQPVAGQDAPGGANAVAQSAAVGAQFARADRASQNTDRGLGVGGVSAAGAKRAGSARPSVPAQQGNSQGQALAKDGQANPNAASGGITQRAARQDAFKKLLDRGRPAQHNLEQQQLTAQTVKGMGIALKDGGGEATIRLAPDGLGLLKINVKVQDAQVVATIAPTTESARQLLIDSTPTLRDALEAQGLSVERIVIEDLPSEHGKHDAQAGNTPGQGTRGTQDAPAREPRDGGAFAQQFGADGEQGRSRDSAQGREDRGVPAQGRAGSDGGAEAPVAAWWNSTFAGKASSGIEWIA